MGATSTELVFSTLGLLLQAPIDQVSKTALKTTAFRVTTQVWLAQGVHTRAEKPSAGLGLMPARRRGWDSNPRGGVSPLRHFECRALDRTMRPLRVFTCCSVAPNPAGFGPHMDLHYPGLTVRLRRERDLNPRGGANPQRHFQCRALGQTMRSLQESPSDRRGSERIMVDGD